MFRIGEFSQVARVSGRLLRYYDSIGLLHPVRIDPQTGYRYYSASQLPRLNRILALKELGLALEQIARLIDDKVSAEEIRGMLMLKRAELEQSLQAEASRLRQIESRLAQIEQEGSLADYDVVIKSAPAQPYLSVRAQFPRMDDAIAMLREVARAVTARIAPRARDKLIVVAYSDFEDENLDLEIGCALTRDLGKNIALSGQQQMTTRELAAVDRLATLVRSGPDYQGHLAFGALGFWMEANGYQIAGPCREVFLDMPFQTPGQEDPIIEIQFPVSKAA
jgi:DNA-binding transcriptional MerR regulator